MGNSQRKNILPSIQQPTKGVPKEGVLYQAYKKNIKPLDLFFFKGTDFTSSIVSFVERITLPSSGGHNYIITKDTFTHVGLVVTSDILDDERLEKGKLYLLESTISGVGNDITPNIDGGYHSGVQIRDLDTLVACYDHPIDAAVATSHLLTEYYDPEVDITADLKVLFTDVYRKYSTMSYTNFVNLPSSVFSCLRPVRRVEHTIFCSELVASIFKDIGILPDTVDPRNVVPMDFFGLDAEKNPIERVPVVISRPTAIVSMFHFRSQQDETLISDVNLDIDWFGDVLPQSNPAIIIQEVLDTTPKKYYVSDDDTD